MLAVLLLVLVLTTRLVLVVFSVQRVQSSYSND